MLMDFKPGSDIIRLVCWRNDAGGRVEKEKERTDDVNQMTEYRTHCHQGKR